MSKITLNDADGRASMNSAQVVSIHFPKAAGSSLKVQYVKLLGDSVALDYTHDPLTTTGSEAAEFPNGKRLVHGSHVLEQRPRP